ncbi:MAG: acyloxyacyl hydrolase [Bacteroidales bacterium]|nr:acyloxyacyl hydrolase [Bacteroidales bacterium]
MRLRIAAALLMTAASYTATQAQETEGKPRYNHIVSAGVGHGKMLQTNDFLRGDNALGRPMERQTSCRLAFGWQTTGCKEWEIAHRLPSFGIGVSTFWLDNRDEMGQPISLFGYYDGVFWRHGAHALRYNIEMGVGTHWKEYDRESNPNNIAIGSGVTVHIGIGLGYAYTIADRWIVSLGAGVNHFSNGALRKPNKGLNLFSGQMRVAYLLRDNRLPRELPTVEKRKGNEIDVTLGYGRRQYEVDPFDYPDVDDEYDPRSKFNAITLQTTFLHSYSTKGKYGGGLSLLYDEYMGSTVDAAEDGRAIIGHGPTHKRFALGVLASHEFCIARLGIVTQLGYYLIRPTDIVPKQRKEPLFQRAGLKYTFACNIHAGLNIYAHRLSVADFIEWNVGYSLPLKRKNSSL